MSKPLISVALATHNEEKNLSMCLDSVKDWVDEIIIADGESTDQTISIAKKYDAKVIKTTNKANFHINKQIAMDEAKGLIVLQLDADEVVDKKMAKFIKEKAKEISTIEKKDSRDIKNYQPKAWNLRRRNFFLGRFLTKGGQYPDPVIRLYINGFARLPQKDVHEQMDVNGNIEFAKGHLLHYSNPSFTDYLRKFNTYTSFKAMQLKEEKIPFNAVSMIEYLLIKPISTFVSLYIRHKGFQDGLAGFVFALMSGIYWKISYLKLWELYERKN
ncbi:MAG: glycosyltransferase family 2 protein [Candidatus Pacebacteria bacterium]|nr:glycosyltransferase family 2 protein [Candidatus Paceibacterota bacterium]